MQRSVTLPLCPDCCCQDCTDLSASAIFHITPRDLLLCVCAPGVSFYAENFVFNDVEWAVPNVSPGVWSAMVGNIDMRDCVGGALLYSGPIELEVECFGPFMGYTYAFTAIGGALLFTGGSACQFGTVSNIIDTCVPNPPIHVVDGPVHAGTFSIRTTQ